MKSLKLHFLLSATLCLLVFYSCDKIEEATTITHKFENQELPGLTGTIKEEPVQNGKEGEILYETKAERTISVKDPELEEFNEYIDKIQSFDFEEASLITTLTNTTTEEDIYIENFEIKAEIVDAKGDTTSTSYKIEGVYHINQPHTSTEFNKFLRNLMEQLLKRNDIKLSIGGITNAKPDQEFDFSILFKNLSAKLKTLDF